MPGIGSRGADGIDTATAVDKSKGVKARAADDAITIKDAPRYPAGLSAIQGLAADAPVTLINLQLGRYMTEIVDYDRPAKQGGGRFMKTITVGPMQAFTVRQAEAERILRIQAGRDGRGGRRSKIVVAPPKGDCGGKLRFTVEQYGRAFPTCPFADCPHHQDDPHPWSIWMAQHFIRSVRNASVIDSFMDQYDHRAEVLNFGTAVSRARREMKVRNMGMTPGGVGQVF